MLENSEAAKKILLKKETVKAVRYERSLFVQKWMHRFFLLLLLAAAGAAGFYFFPRHEKQVGVDVSIEATNHVLSAIVNYRNFYGHYPPAYARNVLGEPTVSWRVLILPFFDDATQKKHKLDALYKEFDLQEKWDGQNNQRLVEKMPPFYLSPASGHKLKDGLTNFLTVRHHDTVFPGSRTVKDDEVTDLPSETVVLFEAADTQAVPWSSPQDFDYNPDSPTKAAPEYMHIGGLVCGKCSGNSAFDPEPKPEPKFMRKPQVIRLRDGTLVELTPRFFSPWMGFFCRNSEERIEEENEEELMRQREEMARQLESPTPRKKRTDEPAPGDSAVLGGLGDADYMRSGYGYTPQDLKVEDDPIEALKRKQQREREAKAAQEAAEAAAMGITGA